LHFIKGHLNAESYAESQLIKKRLVQMAEMQNSTVYMDTIVSPSMISALAQSLQVPGVSGLSNNTVLFELSEHDGPKEAKEVVDSCLFAAGAQKTILVLRHGDFFFGERRRIHVWLTWNDQENANLMILLSYILLGHPDWADAEIRVFAAMPKRQVDQRRSQFEALIADGRLPVSEKNIRFMSVDNVEAFREMVVRISEEADLTVMGLDLERMRERREEVLRKHPQLHAVLFVHAPLQISFE